MEFYTLANNFTKDAVVDKFASAIWTERYTAPGDFSMELDATPDNMWLLEEGKFLSLSGSKEVMIIDTQSVANGKLTVSGSSLLSFLNERMIAGPVSNAAEIRRKSWLVTAISPGDLLAYIVRTVVVDANPSFTNERIANLTVEVLSSTGTAMTVAVPHGQLLDALKTIAESYAVGMSLYLASASASAYSLKFKVYRGVDRTNPVNGDVVQFSPAMDSLTNVKELRSVKGYKTVAFAVGPSEKSAYVTNYALVEAFPGAGNLLGFDRKVLLILADDVQIVQAGEFPTADEVNKFHEALFQRARDGLANNNYTRVVDGEVVPQSEFQFGIHYGLGDIVELRGYGDFSQQARITEYIRSQDETGERAYPTVSVIDDTGITAEPPPPSGGEEPPLA